MFRRKIKEILPSFSGLTVRLVQGEVITVPWSGVSHVVKNWLHFKPEALSANPALPKRLWLSGRSAVVAPRLLRRAQRNVFRSAEFKVHLPVRGPWWLPLLPGLVVGGTYFGAFLYYSRPLDASVRASWKRVLELVPPVFGSAMLFFLISGLVMVFSYSLAIAWAMWVPVRWRYELRDADGLELNADGIHVLRGRTILRQFPWSSLARTRDPWPAFSTPMDRHRLTYIWLWSKPQNCAMIRECGRVMQRRYSPPKSPHRMRSTLMVGGALILWCGVTGTLVVRALRDLGDEEQAATLTRSLWVALGIVVALWIAVAWLVANPPRVSSRAKRRWRKLSAY